MLLLWCCYGVAMVLLYWTNCVRTVVGFGVCIEQFKGRIINYSIKCWYGVGMMLLWCCHGVTTRCSNYLSNCMCTKCGLGWYSDVNSRIRVKWKTGSLWTVYCVCCCYGVDTRLSKYSSNSIFTRGGLSRMWADYS